MYAYCGNNPVAFVDPSGMCLIESYSTENKDFYYTWNYDCGRNEHIPCKMIGKGLTITTYDEYSLCVLADGVPYVWPAGNPGSKGINDYPNYVGGGSHSGTDMNKNKNGAGLGTPVYVAAGGIVRAVDKSHSNSYNIHGHPKNDGCGTHYPSGNYVTIEAWDGAMLSYCHLQQNIQVKVGGHICILR